MPARLEDATENGEMLQALGLTPRRGAAAGPAPVMGREAGPEPRRWRRRVRCWRAWGWWTGRRAWDWRARRRAWGGRAWDGRTRRRRGWTRRRIRKGGAGIARPGAGETGGGPGPRAFSLRAGSRQPAVENLQAFLASLAGSSGAPADVGGLPDYLESMGLDRQGMTPNTQGMLPPGP